MNELLNSSEEYMLQKHIAQQIIGEVLVTVKDWKILATRLSIEKNEQERFSSVFDRQNLSI